MVTGSVSVKIKSGPQLVKVGEKTYLITVEKL